MNKILFAFLRIMRFLGTVRLKLKGKTEEDLHADRVISGRSWDEFCEQLKLAGTVLI